MFKATINIFENSYRILSGDNKSLFKGTSAECNMYLAQNQPKIKGVTTCNRQACQVHLFKETMFYNPTMDANYCPKCAELINDGCPPDNLLCIKPKG